MQNRSQINFKDRALFYLSKAIVSQGVAGSGWMFDIKAVYGVFFMNFLLDGEEPKLRTDVILSDRDTGRLFSDKLRQIFIALPVFEKDEEQCETDFDRWIYVLKNMEKLERMPFKARKAVFEKLEEIADVGALSKHDRELYENSLDVYRTHLCVMEAAKLEGLEKGRKEGREEGLEKGREEGREEAKLEFAAKLKSDGMSFDAIMKYTGLSLDEIKAL